MARGNKPSIPVEEKKWRAESDAHTLAQAAEIQNDPTRLKAAAIVAKDMVEEQSARLNGLKKVARKAPVKKRSSRRA